MTKNTIAGAGDSGDRRDFILAEAPANTEIATKTQALVTGNTRAPLKKRGNDLYETPAVAVEALLRVEHLPNRIWECAAGRGAIVRVLRGAGHDVLATDLVDYGEPDQLARIDFLLEYKLPPNVDLILTNPPFKLVNQFAEHALALCPRVIMLLRLPCLAGESKRRSRIMESGTLKVVHVFRDRLPRMHQDGWKGKKAAPRMEFAWFVWDRNHNGPTVLNRISWSAP